MREYLKFYINGEWVQAACPNTLEVINPSNETIAGRICLASAVDVERAVKAAHDAFPAWSQTSREERIAVLERIIVEYQKRQEDLARAITEEMGAPAALARGAQAPIGLMHLKSCRDALGTYTFEQDRGTTRILKEPIGVCALITPWNWPMNGDGPTTGQALAAHLKVDMVSFTGSTRAGIEVARVAAPTVKRVTQELGGKSPNLLLADADFSVAVPAGALAAMRNPGQSCNAPTRKCRRSKAVEYLPGGHHTHGLHTHRTTDSLARPHQALHRHPTSAPHG